MITEQFRSFFARHALIKKSYFYFNIYITGVGYKVATLEKETPSLVGRFEKTIRPAWISYEPE